MRSFRIGFLKQLTLVALVVVVALVFPRSADATNPDDDLNASVRVPGVPDEPSIELTVSELGEYVTGPGVPAWLRLCSWQAWSLLEKDAHFAQSFSGAEPTPEDIRAGGGDPDEPWGVVFCPANEDTVGITSDISFTGVLSTWRVADGLPQVVLDFLVARAYASVALPVQLGDSAPFGDDEAPMITQLPTWLWIDESIWQPVSASTPLLFGVSATVTATPTKVVFKGDKEFVDCGANLGPPYDFSRHGDDQSSRCTLTWRHSSAVGDWSLTSTITWAASWACNVQCGTGTLPPFTVTNTRPVRVAELQAVLLPPRTPTD